MPRREMEKHLSLIFYFLINIVIFTSASNVGDLYEPSENNAIDPFENSQIDVGELNDDGHLIRVKRNFNHITGRHEQPYSFERENESENADANDDNSDMNNDETIRYYLNSIKERDVNGQLEKSTSETFNGKLIHVLFITSTSIHPFSLLFNAHMNRKFIVLFWPKNSCFLFPCTWPHSTRFTKRHYRNRKQQNWQWFIEDVHK